MFGFLKKAVTGFVGKLTGKEEEKKKEAEIPQAREKPEELRAETPKETAEEKIEDEIVKQAEKEVLREEKEIEHKAVEQKIERRYEEKKELQPQPVLHQTSVETAEPQEQTPAEPDRREQRKPVFEVKREKKEIAPKVGLLKKITGLFSGSVTIGESEVNPLFEDLRIALLESDVSLDTTEFLIEDLRKRLVGKQIARGSVNDSVKSEVKLALTDLFSGDQDFFAQAARKPKPVKILFIGPNGAGKTTTIAKIAFLLKQKGFTSVISASDTFRAAAIEQASLHGEKLGVRVIKQKYGADPAAVAFDAIAHAKAEKIDFVLIDTAGRQETNYNLVKEMEKINRVVQPDYRIFVGESVAGHSLIEQAKKFHESVGLDGLVLTKLDADAKGGTAFSIAHDLRIPILFIGVGQEYEDLKPFAREWLVDNVLN